MHVKHLHDDSTNEQPLRKKTIFCAYVKPPCTHLELLLLNDVEKIHMKELFLTLLFLTLIFNCTVLKFYCKYFSKIFHKTMGVAFSRVSNIG